MSAVEPREELGDEGVEDMIILNDLNEGALLWNLKIRYENDNIYTYIGSILVAVNPYKMFDIYGLDKVKKYEKEVLGTLPPHLFAIGSAAYSKMIKDRQNQVIVISGESGAGKTESTKLIMQYLAAVNRSGSNQITEQILEATPILEAFGNAKTIRNDNSSRFGKYVEVYFKSGQITGAKTAEYLLEKSRVVTQAQDERNYHVFYEMLAGLPSTEREKYGLQKANKYFYLNQGGNCIIEGKNDTEDFKNLLQAFEVLGFSAEEQSTIKMMLASVLHLGNVYFEKKQIDNLETVEMGSDAEIKWVGHLLDLSVTWLREAMTNKVTTARGERLLSPFNIDQALDARDAIAKALYTTLFSWLVKRTNQVVFKGHAKDKNSSIAILDIFGFEDFKINSFEQLCINYANETLQYYFNKHIFKLEQQEYAKEKINWTAIEFVDNSPVIDLIARKPIGIIHLLDDESHFPKGTDLSFLEKCHYTHTENALYDKPRMNSPVFCIRHYAGKVTYHVHNFLEKNKDTLRNDVMELLITSKVEMISSMFKSLQDKFDNRAVNRQTGRFITMKPRTPTIAASFHESLSSLIDTMSKCNPFFVRCIKPNNTKAAMVFDIPVVLSQLRYTGMLETIRIRKMGYPARMRFHAFHDRYWCLVDRQSLPVNLDSKRKCETILQHIRAKRVEEYQLGSSKVFMREALSQRLDQLRHKKLSAATLVLQRAARGYIARKRYIRMKVASLILQANIRGWIERSRFRVMRRGIIQAQALFRMRREQRRYQTMKNELLRKRQEEINKVQMAKERAEKERQARALAGVAHLEIPPELAYIFSKLDEWQPLHSDRNLVSTVGSVHLRNFNFSLPDDINSFVFIKYTKAYFKEHKWGMCKEPIHSPFLQKTNDVDSKDSIAIFKLILRFMNDINLSGRRETVLADFIVQKGLMNEHLRDEIFAQICNQTWRNPSEPNSERGWWLMANCLSCFPPSPGLFKYLLKYISDHAYNGYKSFCQHKLLQCQNIEPILCRTYPPCMLEWKATRKKVNMALEVTFSDGNKAVGHVDSWTTAEEFVRHLLNSRNVMEGSHGWTLILQDENDLYELAGYNYILDIISEMEVPPAFPVCKSFFLVSTDRTQEIPHYKKMAYAETPHNPDYERFIDIDFEELSEPIPQNLPEPEPEPEPEPQLAPVIVHPPPRRAAPSPPPPRRESFRESPEPQIQRRSTTPSRPAGIQRGGQFGLSMTSKLNQRPTEVPAEQIGLSRSSTLNTRYTKPATPVPEVDVVQEEDEEEDKMKIPLAQDSKLNRRYTVTGMVERIGSKVVKRSAPSPPAGGPPAPPPPPLPPHGTGPPSPPIRESPPLANGHVPNGHVPNGHAYPDEEENHGLSGSRLNQRYVKRAQQYLQQRGIDYGGSKDKITRRKQLEQVISSAISDISEGTQVTSPSDMDKWLDKVFDKVLETNSLDGLSDVRSVERNIKGGNSVPMPRPDSSAEDMDKWLDSMFDPAFGELDNLSNPRTLEKVIKGGGKGLGDVQTQVPQPLPNYAGMNMGLGNSLNMGMGIPPVSPLSPLGVGVGMMDPSYAQLLAQQQQQAAALQAQLQPLQATLHQTAMQNQLLQQSLQQEYLKQQLALMQSQNQTGQAGLGAVPPAPPTPQAKVFGHPPPVPSTSTSEPGPSGYMGARTKFQAASRGEPPKPFSKSITGRTPAPPPAPKPGQEKGVSFAETVEDIPEEQRNGEAEPAMLIHGSPVRVKRQAPAAPSPPPPAPVVPSTPSPTMVQTPPQSPHYHVPFTEGIDTDTRAKTVRIGKVRWPPPKEETHKEERRIGKLWIEEQKALRSTPQGRSSADAHERSMAIIRSLSKDNPPEPVPEPPKPQKETPKQTPKLKSRMSNLESKVKLLEKQLGGKGAKSPSPKQDAFTEPPTPSLMGMPPPPPPPPPPGAPVAPPPVKRPSPVPIDEESGEPTRVQSPVSIRSSTSVADLGMLEAVSTILHPQCQGPFYTYHRVPWQLLVRKEVFSPNEKIDNPLLLMLIYCQVVQDVHSNACLRISQDDKKKMKAMLDGYDINPDNMLNSNIKSQVKKIIVDVAKDWPLYFARLYPVAGGHRHPEVQMIGVSHSGIRLVRRVKGVFLDSLEVLEQHRFEDLTEVSVPRASTLQLKVRDRWIILYTHRANQIRNMINEFCIESEWGNSYVRAVKDYVTRESTLLSFTKGEYIRLTHKDTTLDKGWLHGSIRGRQGMFPIEYVIKVNRDEMQNLTKTLSKRETRPKQPTPVINDAASDISTPSTIVPDGKYSMMEFAILHFRESLDKKSGPATRPGILKKASNWTWKEQAQMVQWTRSPIQASLLPLKDQQLNKLGKECFLSVMQYMGDYPLPKDKTVVDCVYQILRACHNHPALRDEVYCQLCKQTTTNRSPKETSIQMGWRLMSQMTTWFPCSDTLRPYLVRYIQGVAFDASRAQSAVASVCIQNLRKTFKVGGRKNTPNEEEIKAVSDGRISKRQTCLLAGIIPVVLNVRPSTVVQDIIEEICVRIKIENLKEMDEYSLIYILEKENRYVTLGKNEYIFDVTTELVRQKKKFVFLFQRTTWVFPVQLVPDCTENYLDIMYHQSIPDFLDGYPLVLENNMLSKHKASELAQLGALQLRANDVVKLATTQQVLEVVPIQVRKMPEPSPQQWVNMVHAKMREVQTLSPIQSKVKFLEMHMKWRLFGSTFFTISHVTDPRVNGPCLLAINKNGLDFLHERTHESLVVYPYSEIISTRRGRTEGGTSYVDMKCGNMMQQKIVRIETDQGGELGNLIGQYISLLNSFNTIPKRAESFQRR